MSSRRAACSPYDGGGQHRSGHACGRVPQGKIYDRITELLELVNLEPDQYRSQYPSQLSGGQRQRIGVARAFAADPEIILMDEPFSALDPMTRAELQDEVHRLQLRFHKTIVFVTHDMDEAVKLADRICILQNGHVVQCDKPENILKHPANEYINSFIGKNRLWENPSFIRAEGHHAPPPHHHLSEPHSGAGGTAHAAL